MMQSKKNWLITIWQYPNSHNETTDEPIGGQYAGYGDDKYIVAYLEAINEELPNLLMIAEWYEYI